MVTEEKAAEKPEAPTAPERPPLFTLTGWIVVIGVCLVEGIVFWVVGNWTKKDVPKTEGPAEIAVSYWTLDPSFQVTIAQDGLFHNYEVKIALGMDRAVWDKEEDKKKIEGRKAKIRDAILTVLQRQTWPDVVHVDGQRKLKEEILRVMQSVLGQDVVQEVCFESFTPR